MFHETVLLDPLLYVGNAAIVGPDGWTAKMMFRVVFPTPSLVLAKVNVLV